MIIGALHETNNLEKRILLSLETVKKLSKENLTILITKGYGLNSNISDQELIDSGATIDTKENILKNSDVVLKISLEESDEIKLLKNGANIVLNNFDKKNLEILKNLKSKNINIFSLDFLPRITRAQSMDILSSQANLAGYRSVIDSSYEFNKAVPMMMTAAGTVTPAKFFIIGAGVAGLQAIATAKRLGGAVSATDVRLASKEQVESLGGKFVFVEDAENLETEGGYAKEASEDFKKKQEELLKETVKKQDIIICTALIPGKKAPRIITEEMVLSMKPGSIICDLAAAQGGNSAFSEPDKVVDKNGIKIIGYTNIASRISETASNLLAKNIYNFIDLIYDKENKTIKIDKEDEIIKGVLMNGEQ
ncbi:Re/Si-specific NAD(P)(+) transhydrogenase subunit alpha [Pelagibacteraceae bacterium]|nr:Re/Si-specific NAD(P)(+) transhydrogenase subunit alpha [Pelagibacteraceae bacterium]